MAFTCEFSDKDNYIFQEAQKRQYTVNETFSPRHPDQHVIGRMAQVFWFLGAGVENG